MEKQRDKAAKRLQRKLEKNSPEGDGPVDGAESTEFAEGMDGLDNPAADADSPHPAGDPTL